MLFFKSYRILAYYRFPCKKEKEKTIQLYVKLNNRIQKGNGYWVFLLIAYTQLLSLLRYVLCFGVYSQHCSMGLHLCRLILIHVPTVVHSPVLNDCRYLIRLLGDPPVHHIYRERNILANRLACMASATNLGSKRYNFSESSSSITRCFVGRPSGQDAYKTNSFDKYTGNWRVEKQSQQTRRCSNFASNAPNCPSYPLH